MGKIIATIFGWEIFKLGIGHFVVQNTGGLILTMLLAFGALMVFVACAPKAFQWIRMQLIQFGWKIQP